MDADTQKLAEIFLPHYCERKKEVEDRNIKFAHYTSAEAGASIIRNKEIWSRRPLVMNDASEISYGSELIKSIYKNNKHKISSTLSRYLPYHLDQVLNSVLWGIDQEIYITSFSEHWPDDDDYGRLSMWRAYGERNGIAIVMDSKPFLTEPLGIGGTLSLPTIYAEESMLAEYFLELIQIISSNESFLLTCRPQMLDFYFRLVFRHFCLGTKHAGFKEEREWRTIMQKSCLQEDVKFEIDCINKIPQKVCKTSLGHPTNKALPNLIEKIIIGPTQTPEVLREAFVHLLHEAGVANAEEKVVCSNIPLRV